MLSSLLALLLGIYQINGSSPSVARRLLGRYNVVGPDEVYSDGSSEKYCIRVWSAESKQYLYLGATSRTGNKPRLDTSCKKTWQTRDFNSKRGPLKLRTKFSSKNRYLSSSTSSLSSSKNSNSVLFNFKYDGRSFNWNLINIQNDKRGKGLLCADTRTKELVYKSRDSSGNKPELKRRTLGSKTYNDAKKECERYSSRVASKQEILDYLGSNIGKGGDSWVPVQDSYNEWLQIGDSRSGQLHSKLDRGIHGKPSWGTSRVSRPYKKIFYCAVSQGVKVREQKLSSTVRTYREIKKECERASGSRMASQQEIIDYLGNKMNGKGADSWVPVRESDNEWLQVGDSRAGKLHTKVAGFKPEWGTRRGYEAYRKIYYCATAQASNNVRETCEWQFEPRYYRAADEYDMEEDMEDDYMEFSTTTMDDMEEDQFDMEFSTTNNGRRGWEIEEEAQEE